MFPFPVTVPDDPTFNLEGGNRYNADVYNNAKY